MADLQSRGGKVVYLDDNGDSAYDLPENGFTQLDTLYNTMFFSSEKSITSNLTIPSDRNYMSVGPITIAEGITVTLTDDADWTIV
jgi:hypothetical protein